VPRELEAPPGSAPAALAVASVPTVAPAADVDVVDPSFVVPLAAGTAV